MTLRAVGRAGLPGPLWRVPLQGPLIPPSDKTALKLKGLYLPVSFLSHMSHLFSRQCRPWLQTIFT